MNILEKYPVLKGKVITEIEKRFPGEKYIEVYYEAGAFISEKGLFKFEVFFRDTEHRAYLSIHTNYSTKAVPVYWNELEFVKEGFLDYEIVSLSYSLTKEQIMEYFPSWHETFIWQNDMEFLENKG